MKKLFYISALSVLLLAACGSDDNETNDKTNLGDTEQSETNDKTTPGDTEQSETNNDIFFDGTVAKLRDVQVEITDTKIIEPGEKGNEYSETPIIAFWYNATNLSDKEIDPTTAWLAIFDAIQDNDPNAVNTLEVAGLPDNQFSDTQLQIIKKDGTVPNAIAYELDELETPVTLVASQGVGGDKLGEKVIELK